MEGAALSAPKLDFPHLVFLQRSIRTGFMVRIKKLDRIMNIADHFIANRLVVLNTDTFDKVGINNSEDLARTVNVVLIFNALPIIGFINQLLTPLFIQNFATLHMPCAYDLCIS